MERRVEPIVAEVPGSLQMTVEWAVGYDPPR